MPPLELEHIWIWFQEVFEPGTGANGSIPPTYLEIEAYARLVLGHPISAFEIRGVRGLADAYVRIERASMARRRAQSKNPRQPIIRRTVSMEDSEGLRSLFAGVGSRPRAGAKTPPPTPPAR